MLRTTFAGTKWSNSEVLSAGATICRTRQPPRAQGQRERQKYNCVVQKVTNVHQKKGMSMIKVNATHVPTVY